MALTKVKFCKVEEPVARMFASVARPEAFKVVPKRFEEKKLVVVA